MRFALSLIITVTLLGCTAQPLGENTQTSPPASPVSSAALAPRSSWSSSEVGSVSSVSPEVPRPKSSVLLAVPFSPQAPFAKWDDLHNEACEEASLLMVHHFLSDTGMSRDQAERELQELAAWETAERYGVDVNVEELKAIAQRFYGYRGRIELHPSPDRIRELITEGHPVIMPIAGRLLGNPNFRGAGPWYHMLVVRGFRTSWLGTRIFITNDPGTRKGEGYEYTEEVLMNALHDWTGVKEEIATGRKAILVVEK